jgi:UDP-N-acetylmuramate dehydrogenase
MLVKENYSLRTSNSFGIAANTRFFTEVNSQEEIVEVLTYKGYQGVEKLWLGGGSNILLKGNFQGAVVKVNLMGIKLDKEDDHYYYVSGGAGENWHDFVTYCIDHDYSGVENLSLIPGNVGAAPMQNIGAYGVELKEVFYSLEAINVHSGELVSFSNADCHFGYRTSIFKEKEKGNFVICEVTFRLKKNAEFNVSYGALQQQLEKMQLKELSISAISKAVCSIRRSKLPNPDSIGNAGSFFKNPIIDNAFFESLKKDFPDIVGFANTDSNTKVAAGWLIEQCGWKGKRVGDAGVHEDHALVLANYGIATGEEIFNLSEDIKASVIAKFGISLEREVNVI